MHYIIALLLLLGQGAWAQDKYNEYETYETFSELDRFQRDYGLIFIPSLIYTKIEEDNEISGGTVTDRSRNLFIYDVRLGYIFRGGFYFGILYAGESQDVSNSSTSAPNTSRESVGLSFGYIKKGLSLTASLFPYSKQSLENVTVSDYSEGFGYQLDAAYYFRLGRYASLGPQIVFKSIRYGRSVDGTTNVSSDASSQHDVFTPMVSLMINLYRG